MFIRLDKHPKKNLLRFFIGDVRDRDRLKIATQNVDYIIHAAALKHIPATEYNPTECIRTNILGAENVIYAALENNVKKIISLSTDKASNPINIYGASKLASDKLIVSGNHLAANGRSKFSVVRYGNVIGSRGSIFWIIQKALIKKIKYVPITDKDMTRFWISLEQGVEFVLSCLDIMKGGEIYVPKLPSSKVIDLINYFCPKIKKSFIGIRPGEKLHETLISSDESRETLEFKDRYVIEPSIAFWDRNFKKKLSGKKVFKNFEYKSNTNKKQLNFKNLEFIIKNLK